jgi:hypothetical protein
MNVRVGPEECAFVLRELHSLLFAGWQDITDLKEFAVRLELFLDLLADKSMVSAFPFNLKVMDKLYSIADELKSLSFSKERFPPAEIWEIFRQKLQAEMISFTGSPLRGIQILGLFETRSLHFKNVIVMDMNESVLPRLKIYEPLIPREVMLNLGLNRLEKEEEIQRYHFMRLISSADNVYLIYEENQEKEKSRFIEELIWRKQKQEAKLEIVEIPRASFSVRVASQQREIIKTPDIINYLKQCTYSSSRLDTYLNCPLQFYYQYILGLKEKEDLLETPQAAQLGTFIHELLEDTFSCFKGKKPHIDAKFRNYFFTVMEDKFRKEIEPRMKSDSFLLKDIIRARLEKFLDLESERNVARIIALEERLTDVISVNGVELTFTYTIDRIDESEDGSIVIIDYKTGGADVVPKSLKSLEKMVMNRQSIRENIKSFQLPLYYYFTRKRMPNSSINAEIYNIRTLKRKSFINVEDIPNATEVMEICMGAVSFILTELFDLDIAFVAEHEGRRCKVCPFSGFCGR